MLWHNSVTNYEISAGNALYLHSSKKLKNKCKNAQKNEPSTKIITLSVWITYCFVLRHSKVNSATKQLLDFGHYWAIGEWYDLYWNATVILLPKCSRSLPENHRKRLSTFTNHLFITLCNALVLIQHILHYYLQQQTENFLFHKAFQPLSFI